jgi:hypothetical protein
MNEAEQRALCQIIGINPKQENWWRDFNRAIDVLNTHYNTLNDEWLRNDYQPGPYVVDVPFMFRAQFTKDRQQVRFVAVSRPTRAAIQAVEDEDDRIESERTEAPAPVRPQSIPRVRVSKEQSIPRLHLTNKWRLRQRERADHEVDSIAPGKVFYDYYG